MILCNIYDVVIYYKFMHEKDSCHNQNLISVSNSTKLYKVHICYDNLSGFNKSSEQVHNMIILLEKK